MSRTTWAVLTMALVAWAPPATAEVVTRRWGTPPAASGARGPRTPAPIGYAVPAADAPAIDGKLDDRAWAAAPVLALARTLDGSVRAAVATEVRAVQDGKTLWLAIRCIEPLVAKVRAERRSHDGPATSVGGLWTRESSWNMFRRKRSISSCERSARPSSRMAMVNHCRWSCASRSVRGRSCSRAQGSGP